MNEPSGVNGSTQVSKKEEGDKYVGGVLFLEKRRSERARVFSKGHTNWPHFRRVGRRLVFNCILKAGDAGGY